MLSVHTNFAGLVAQNSVNKSNAMLSNAIERLSTGKRINSAADDAAGLQIATRLEANVTGMKAAQRNISDATSMLQTADGALAELTNITNRQKELATQALNGVNSDKDRDALDAEFQQLTKEAERILTKTDYAGNNLFGVLETAAPVAPVPAPGGGPGAPGVAAKTGVTFQIGSGKDETLSVGFAKINLADVKGADLQDAANSKTALEKVDELTAKVGEARSTLGAGINRLGHTASNLANVIQNTTAAAGRIMDADFAAESAAMTKSQMLVQAGTNVLSRANQNTSLVMGLLR